MLTSKPPLPEKLLMPMPPGKEDIMLKRDSHSIPQLRPGLLTCQTMLLKTQTSTSKPQPQLRKSLLMLPRLNKLLRTKPTPQRRLKRVRLPPKHQLPPKPQLLLLPHHSFNSTRAETLLKRKPELKPASHQDLNHHQALHPPLTLIQALIE